MEQPVFLIVLVIIIPVGASVDMCMDGSKPCPRDRPYCTEVGCVYQCPDQYLINGTTCVWSCGDAITDLSNKSCISTCPTPGMLIFEEVVRIGNQLRKQKVCLDDCNKYFIDKYGAVAYQFGNTCVKACPDEAIFLLDNKCVPECPNNLTVRLNITDPMWHVLIGVQCRSGCYFIDRMSPSNWYLEATPVIENNFCVEWCSGKRLILENGTCVDECPASQNLTVDVLLNSDKYESMCIDECLDSELLNNSTGQCVKKCPSESPYIYNSTCVQQCPLSQPLIKPVTITLVWPNIRKWVCVKQCDPGYFLFKECVDRCNDTTEMTHKTTCVRKCPNDAPVSLNGTCIRECPNECPVVEANQCVSACSMEKVFFNGKCRGDCPKDMYIFNATCVQQCPVSHPLIKPDTVSQGYTSIPIWVCVKQCDPGYFLFKVCVDRCNDTSEMTHKTTCVRKCPYDAPVSLNGTCIRNCPNEFPVVEANHCVSECYWGRVSLNGKCQLGCPTDLYIFNSTCIQQCPVSHPLIKQDTVPQGNWRYIPIWVCVKQCNPGFFLFKVCVDHCNDTAEMTHKTTCVRKCPNDAPLTLNGICLKSCPISHPLERVHDNVCVVSCNATVESRFNMSCVRPCPSILPYSLEGNCVKRCPSNALIQKRTNTCVKECQSTEVIEERYCKGHCENSTFIENGKCINSCPSVHPYAKWKNFANGINNYECLSDCGTGTYIFNSTCSTKNECFYPVSRSTRQCANSCPLNLLRTYYGFPERIHCVEFCDSSKKILDGKCVSTCPANRNYIANKHCVEKCPASMRYVDNHRTCSEKCPSWKYSLNDTCIFESNCATAFDEKPGVLFNRECMQHCPFWYFRTPDSTCQSRIPFICSDIAAFVLLGIFSFLFRRRFGDIALLTKCGWWFVTCKKTYNLDKYKDTGMKRHEGTDPVEDTTDAEGLGERTTLDEEGCQLDSVLSSVPTVVNVRNHLDMAEFNDPVEIQIDIHDTSPLRRLTSDEAHRQLSESEPNGSEQEETRVKELACDFIVECLAEAQDAPQLHVNETLFG